MINLYTLPNCPICNVMKKKLSSKNIQFNELNLEDYISELGEYAPVLEVNNHYYKTPSEINNWLNQQ